MKLLAAAACLVLGWSGAAVSSVAAATVTPWLRVNNIAVKEFVGTATFTVTLSAPATGSVSVHYATRDDTAKAPGDYTSKSGTLTFPAGTTKRTVGVHIVNDPYPEFTETFDLVLSAAHGASIADASGTCSIAFND